MTPMEARYAAFNSAMQATFLARRLRKLMAESWSGIDGPRRLYLNDLTVRAERRAKRRYDAFLKMPTGW